MTKQEAKNCIERYWKLQNELNPKQSPAELNETLEWVISHLEQGKLRVAEKIDNHWQTNQWVKQAILLYFKTSRNQIIDAGYSKFYDKVPLLHQHMSAQHIEESKVRIVPHALVRRGAFVAPNSVLMPSYTNIGAYIDHACMVDTWATVGSCAQIGKNVHLSGGVGIGGVLEPLQANPTIIEDDCFIGARSEIVEGVIVEEGSVISMGVYIGQSTKIYDRENDKILYGKVPKGSVVVAGSLPSSKGNCNLYAAIIVKKVTAQTKQKVGINQILREAQE